VKLGHEVMVIDHDANALARLGPDFKGRVVHGIGFDRKYPARGRRGNCGGLRDSQFF